MPQAVSFFIGGVPVAQGSKVGIVMPGKNGARPRAVLIDAAGARKHLKPWRLDVAHSAAQAVREHPSGAWDSTRPAECSVTFYFQRPQSHFGSKKGVAYLKAGASRFQTSTPDVDKLMRAMLDALTGLLWTDDSRVYSIRAVKLYCNNGERPGAQVSVTTD